MNIAKSLFLQADKDGSKYLDYIEILHITKRFVLQMKIDVASEEEIKQEMQKVNKAKDGHMLMNEFIIFCNDLYN